MPLAVLRLEVDAVGGLQDGHRAAPNAVRETGRMRWAESNGRRWRTTQNSNIVPPGLRAIEIIKIELGNRSGGRTAERYAGDRQGIIHIVVHQARVPIQHQRDLVPAIGLIGNGMPSTLVLIDAHRAVVALEEERNHIDIGGGLPITHDKIATGGGSGNPAHIKADVAGREAGECM